MTDFDIALPALLAELHQLPFDYAEGQGIDFEPYRAFLTATESTIWIRAWTGNAALDAHQYRVFGQDGTGGYAAFWLVRDGADLLQQPIVFFGSEGDVGLVARDVADYLWLLAGGIGPCEAVVHGVDERPSVPAFAAFARKHAPSAEKTAREVVETARAEYPGFEAEIRTLCR